jgi:F0F1-type ATP synthase assembly protein I
MTLPPKEKRPPLAEAMEWASFVTSVALLMALPAAAGAWLDARLGTSPWLVIAGALFGSVAGMTQLLARLGLLGSTASRRTQESKTDRQETGEGSKKVN